MLILCRHGNTFEPNVKAVWVGARTDLPLVAEGRAQATRVANHLHVSSIAPKVVVAAPLRRTREFAGIVASAFGLPVKIDDRLRELDYGEWEGKDSAAIASRFGADVLAAWEQTLIWPDRRSCWGEGPDLVKGRVLAMLDHLATLEKPVFACTSNGILRFVWACLNGRANLSLSKVATGAICLLKASGGCFDIVEWNCRPLVRTEAHD